MEDAGANAGDTNVIRGWGCTPTGDLPPAAVTTNDRTKPSCLLTAFGKGWRRTALFAILLFLMVLVFLNIALTLWIISTLRLSMTGIGPIKIVKGGIHLDGQAWISDNLVASTISSHAAQPITLHSHRNFTVLVSDPNHLEHAKLVLKRDSLECSARSFEVRDARGDRVFSASKEEVRVFAESLALDGAGGLTVGSAIQTPLAKAPPGADLELESLTRRLHLRAPQSINLESRAGNIDIISHGDIKLASEVGALKIEAPNIIISNLKEAEKTEKPSKNQRLKKVYQLCACASGKLFLAAPDALCESHDSDTDLCR